MSERDEIIQLWRNLYVDKLAFTALIFVPIFAGIVGFYISVIIGLILILSFVFGCALSLALLKHKKWLSLIIVKVKKYLVFGGGDECASTGCDVCGASKCNRHGKAPNREPWKGVFVDANLDSAVESFYTHILNGFVESWFSLLSQNDDFVQALKHNLREGTCRLILKTKELNLSRLITYKLLPQAFAHYEIVQGMLKDGVPMDKLAQKFHANQNAIHPAVRNRQTEVDYLRAVAKYLLPRLSSNENLGSMIFFSLGRELLACWVLLPLMDVLADPNWLNAIIIAATNKTKTSKKAMRNHQIDSVMFLQNFVEKNDNHSVCDDALHDDATFLSDQHQLYMFMQFLKREGAVDILRFYLDVENLNSELQDPKVIADPTKLSALHQQSETLLETYKVMMKRDYKVPCGTLAGAQDDVRRCLQGKWKAAFHLTPGYFQLIYGDREIRESNDFKNFESQSGTVSRLGLKLKGAIRGAIDGAPLESTEIPTVWDAFSDDAQSNTTVNSNNSNIYSSVTQKLRKERGQNLDAFVSTFMQSIEQSSSTDIGEDVILIRDINTESAQNEPPGRNVVFGDLFELKSPSHSNLPFVFTKPSVYGPTQCLIYILTKIIEAPSIVVKLITGLVHISRTTVDFILCKTIEKLIRFDVYESRLTILIQTIEEHLFGQSKQSATPSAVELLERQRQARARLEKMSKNLGRIADVIQSPALNKHLMYCLFDIIVAEMYPELDSTIS